MPANDPDQNNPSRNARPPAALRDGEHVYGAVFWLAYAANALTMIAISLLVRYADFVTFLGSAEGQLGLIVGAGMLGSLAMRAGQAVGIDRYGPRKIWLASLVMLCLSILGHLFVASAHGIAIFALRILMQTSIAGVFGASITSISRRVPPVRMAEIIGTLGTSGFVGILVGPQIGDWIFASSGAVERSELNLMFLTAAGLVALATLAAWAATRGTTFRVRHRHPPLVALIRRYHPGVMLLVAMAVGAGIALPNTFLRTFAAERSIARIGLFFATYAVVAFAVRMLTRRLFARYDNRLWVLCGLAAMAASLLLYLPVQQSWQLMLPGAAAGVAHALLFPSVVAGGTTAFPERYRGLGTTLMLAMFDMGNLVGAPLVGGVLQASRHLGWPAYPTTFVSTAAAIALVAIVFALRARRAADVRQRHLVLRGPRKALAQSEEGRKPPVVGAPLTSPGQASSDCLASTSER